MENKEENNINNISDEVDSNNQNKQEEKVEDIPPNSTMSSFFNIYNKIEDCYTNKKLWGCSSGFHELDELTNGIHKSELTIIAGRFSMGKTVFALNMATNIAQQEIPVLYVSYDLSKENLAFRVLSSLAEVSGQNIRESRLKDVDWDRMGKAMTHIAKLTEKEYLTFEGDCYLYYKDLFDLIRKFKEEHPNGVVFVDYFQLVRLYKQEDTRIIELSSLAAAFKHLTMELEMPIILVSQVNKKCEERADKRPLLSDLAECDALAQHADNLLFIYREEYYEVKDDYEVKCESKNEANIIVAKQKNGPRGEFKLLYQSNIFKFKNPIRYSEF